MALRASPLVLLFRCGGVCCSGDTRGCGREEEVRVGDSNHWYACTSIPIRNSATSMPTQASSYLDPLLPPLPPGARRRWSSKGNKTRCGEPKSTGKQIQCGDDTQFGGG
ncbi:uncharacterized protein [Miscanthus floridulus]|uniref:uncharacterized protein isoform X2 n=1 Tax=Miscanthus floridulus TaxID=154761 RepID=UPI0034599495